MRAAIAILSTENLLHNVQVLKQAAPGRKILAMIKANAYGHGLRSVAKRLEHHVDSLGVASIDEALALRHVGVKGLITLMEGVFDADELLLASSQKFEVVIHNFSQIEWLEKSRLPLPLKLWLKIDSGMGRLGIAPSEFKQAYERLSAYPYAEKPIQLMTHLACADVPDHPLNQQQLQRFDELVSNLPGVKSAANSAAALGLPSSRYDVIRPGLSLYGVSPLEGKTASELNLRPVMTLQTRLITTQILKRGTSIGYGAEFSCPADMPVGVIALGYGDGYPRTARTGTPVLVNQKECQIVGRVSMDMISVDLRNCPDAKVGDPVLLWGDQLPIERVAAHTSHVPYDLLCAVQPRVKFHWTVY